MASLVSFFLFFYSLLNNLKRQQRGNCFCRFSNRLPLPESYFHPLDLSYVSSVAHKVLHASSCKGLLSLQQIQPQPLCLHVAMANDDNVDPGCSAGVTLQTRGQGEVIGDNWTQDGQLLAGKESGFRVKVQLGDQNEVTGCSKHFLFFLKTSKIPLVARCCESCLLCHSNNEGRTSNSLRHCCCAVGQHFLIACDVTMSTFL